MTAFELCRRRPELELAPVLRIVKYLGLDSGRLDDDAVTRIADLYSHFRHDPELIVGTRAIAERSGVPAERIETLLRARRREIPFLGTPERPMVPAVALDMLRRAEHGAPRLTGGNPGGTPSVAAPAPDTVPAPELQARIGRLERELEAALEQVRSLGRTLDRMSDQVSRDGARRRRPRHRRSGGGRPDTIVEACRHVLAASREPMKVADITEQVISSGVEIRAKNPNVTVSSILSSYEVFARVRRGYYTLA